MHALVKLSTSAAFTIAFAAAATAAHAATYTVDSGSSELEFKAVGKPGFLKINGKGAKVDGKATTAPGGDQGDLKTKLDDFVTGIDLRDEHMKKKYLEVEKFPTAELKWKTTKSCVDGGEVPFTGQLTFHGVTKDVNGTATVDPSSDKKKLGVDATFSIKLSDYKVDIPSYLGVTVAEDVEVHVKFDAKGG